jgi:threonyl-tRNA synthetase
MNQLVYLGANIFICILSIYDMRVLQIHCSSFNYEIKKETLVAEQPPNPNKGVYENILVCFTCFEKQDENKIEYIIDSYTDNIKIDTGRVGTKRVLIYPYAHLSKTLGSPRLAKEFLKKLKERLSSEGLEVYGSPFGWYKAFSLSCIGHPLAEAYREY